MNCYKFIIKGKVQGVFYRRSIYKAAKIIGLKGYIKNLNNGDVKAIALLDDNNFENFINILKNGSPNSITKDIISFECDEFDFDNFEIRY